VQKPDTGRLETNSVGEHELYPHTESSYSICCIIYAKRVKKRDEYLESMENSKLSCFQVTDMFNHVINTMSQSQFQLHSSSMEKEKEEAVIFNYLIKSSKM
jgi:hypothetical protein